MRIIDTHTHIFPDYLAHKAVQGICESHDIPCYADGRVSTLLEQMQENTVERSFILGVATKPEQVPVINQYLAETALEHPQLVPVGALHPAFINNIEEIEEASALGIKGFKLHPYFQNFNIDDPRLDDVYALLQEKKLPLIFHAGIEIKGQLSKAMPADFLKLRQRFKKLKIVLAHLGGNLILDMVENELAGSDFYFDTAYIAEYADLFQFETIVKKHGSERVFFASDSPWGKISKQIAFIYDSRLTFLEKELIFYKNAEVFYKI